MKKFFHSQLFCINLGIFRNSRPDIKKSGFHGLYNFFLSVQNIFFFSKINSVNSRFNKFFLDLCFFWRKRHAFVYKFFNW